MTSIVQAENLSRFYGIILGLNNVSFRIGGGITGVVGPNGAGKTTLFRLLTGQIRPSSGTLRVFDADPWNNPATQARIGYCPESEEIPEHLRPGQWLRALGMISGLSAVDARARADEALDQAQLAPQHRKKRLGQMSKGMKQRVKLAQCLVHRPGLVILDEPMNGLDPMGREEFAVVLRQLAKDGTSVVVSSHILHDLEALCGAFLLLRWGRMPRAGNTAAAAETRQQWPRSTTFRCDAPERLARYLFDQQLVRGCEIASESSTLRVQWTDPGMFYGRFHEHLLASGAQIFEVRSTTSFLEKAIESPLHA